jgi:hypothetical protein
LTIGPKSGSLAQNTEEPSDPQATVGGKAATHPRRRSLARGITNRSDIPFQVVHRVVVERLGSP